MSTSTSITDELDAIRSGAAIYHLTDRAFLRITGADATRWLNGMVTNNVAALTPGEGNYNFLLNAQGRIQGDCTIYREPGDGPATYILETGKSQLEAIQAHLDKFIIMDDVELAPVLEDNSGLLLVGPSVIGTLDAALIWPPDPISLSHGDIADRPLVLRIAQDQVEIWGTANDIAWVSGFFPQQNSRVSAEALEAFRILSAVPKFGTDITEKYLPQETAQTHALHFSKGCYLGQEIVERIHSRGQVHRLFSQFTLTGETPTLPALLESNSKPAGELTSAMQIGDKIYALGYARRELLDAHQPLTYTGGIATPSRTNLEARS